MKAVKKYSKGGAQESPRKAIERRIKELRNEIAVARRTDPGRISEGNRQSSIKALQAQIRDLEAKLSKLG